MYEVLAFAMVVLLPYLFSVFVWKRIQQRKFERMGAKR